jgi:hypothetical protein
MSDPPQDDGARNVRVSWFGSTGRNGWVLPWLLGVAAVGCALAAAAISLEHGEHSWATALSVILAVSAIGLAVWAVCELADAESERKEATQTQASPQPDEKIEAEQVALVPSLSGLRV